MAEVPTIVDSIIQTVQFCRK